MGSCPCFGTKKKAKSSSRNQENENQIRPQPTSDNPSVKTKVNLEPKLSLLDPKDKDQVKSKANIFSYRELAKATNNFRDEAVIGEGGFGAVYKGLLERTSQIVAVKMLNHAGLQGDKEFLVEVLMLSLLRHPNLVNLIGYCAEGKQRLLVYEFMPLGSLESHLHDLTPDMAPLDWNTRMKIAAGAAKGLNFLHNQADPPVIYRDLKSSNILLDEGFHTKLSDFGLAKFGPEDDKSHVSTRVMGTHGYCAPEYAGTGKLTIKSDIYSFGVVLMELITGRRALDLTREKGKHYLVEWARPFFKDSKSFVNLADPRLQGQFSEPVLRKTVEVTLMCLREDPQKRPSMVDVVHALNYLASRRYDPNAVGGGASGRRSPQVDSTSNSPEIKPLLNKNQERERAVAEAKMWGEAFREKTK